MKQMDKIESFSYLTMPFRNNHDLNVKDVKGSDLARANQQDLNIEGASPNMFDTLLQDYIDIHWRTDSALSLGEQLYSKRGSQSGATGAYQTEFFNYDPSNYT